MICCNWNSVVNGLPDIWLVRIFNTWVNLINVSAMEDFHLQVLQ